MAAKMFLVLFASALFVQSTVSQCTGRNVPYRSGFADEFAYGSAWPSRVGCGGIVPAVDISIASSLSAAYGGGLPVSSSSCAAPTGLAVASENIYDGPVAVGGNLPFLGTAAMEGIIPTAGASVISYGCGDGIVGITAEEPIGAAIAPAGIPSMASWGYKGVPARGYGCGCGCGSSYAY